MRTVCPGLADLLPEYMIQTGGQILLGCPVGPDQASVHVGGLSYRAERVEQMVNDHDERLRAVVDLARWNGSRNEEKFAPPS